MSKPSSLLRFRMVLWMAVWAWSSSAAAEGPGDSSPWSQPNIEASSEAGRAPSSRLRITSDSTCPSAPAVTEALSALVPTVEWPSGTVSIQAAATSCIVVLASEASARREISLPVDCELRAHTLALVIATWTGELASEVATAPVLRTPRSAPPKAIAAETGPPTRAAPPVASTIERELAAGLLLSFSGGLAPGMRLDFIQTRAPRGWGWQVGLAMPTPRDRAAGEGTTRWTRTAANVCVNLRITLHRFVLTADAGVAGTYTITSGRGYSVDQSWESITGGAVAGTRLALTWQHLRVWTDLRGYKWIFPQSLVVRSPQGDRLATVSLPSGDLQWSVGLAYLFD